MEPAGSVAVSIPIALSCSTALVKAPRLSETCTLRNTLPLDPGVPESSPVLEEIEIPLLLPGARSHMKGPVPPRTPSWSLYAIPTPAFGLNVVRSTVGGPLATTMV